MYPSNHNDGDGSGRHRQWAVESPSRGRLWPFVLDIYEKLILAVPEGLPRRRGFSFPQHFDGKSAS